MKGAYLPGNSTVELKEVEVPVPGHGEVLLRMKASTICGSDIRCIYHEHLGKVRKATRAWWPATNRAGRSCRRARDAVASAWATA